MDFADLFLQGSVATQLSCGGVFSNHFIANFSRNVPVKKFWESDNHMDKSLWLTFLGHPVFWSYL